MFSTIFKIIYLVEMLAISIVRKIFTAKHRRMKLKEDRKTVIDMIMLGVVGVGMVIPLFHVFTDWFVMANYGQPEWLNWVGVVIFALCTPMLWKTQSDLGDSWTPEPAIREEHKLVTKGIYKFIRHPMYAVHIYWGIAQILIFPNWIVGPSLLVPSLILYLYRVKGEEQMMIEQFGEQYREYMKRTGRLFPKLIGRGR